jgi:predicted nucleic acid-binding protein
MLTASSRELGKKLTERSRLSTQTFLLDSNVFIAAIKNPRRQTDTLRLIVRIIEDSKIELVGDELLLDEMLRYAELLRSQTAATIVDALLSKTSMVRVSRSYRKICKAYIETPDGADILHAGTCLQTGATLITNDHHFDRIRKEGIIKVWAITEAIGRLLASR